MFGLNIGRMGRVGGSQISPIPALFAAGEQGAWYDPSDMTTLYQLSAGTAPVTAVGQPVGLMLDKRLGLVRGVELVTDPTLDTPGAWLEEGVAGTFVVGGGKMTVNTSPGASTTSRNGGTGYLLANRTYELTYTVDSFGGNFGPIFGVVAASGTGGGFWQVGDYISTAAGSKRVVFNAGGSGVLGLRRINGHTGTAVIDNISVRELPGNPALQATTTARPLNQASPARLVFDGVDDQHNTAFATALGSACTVVRSVPGTGASILTGQTIGTSYANTVTHSGLIIINRALTGAETAAVTQWANQRAGV